MLPLSNLRGPYHLQREPSVYLVSFGKQATTKPKALTEPVAPGLYSWENFTEFDFLIILGRGGWGGVGQVQR